MGSILGFFGVIISLLFSKRLDTQNKMFQEKLDRQNKEFQTKLEDERKKYDLWSKKYETLIQMLSYRYDVRSPEYTAAMNGIMATFFDSKEVINETKKLYDALESEVDEHRANEYMVKIYLAMFKELGITENIDEVFLNKCFNGK